MARATVEGKTQKIMSIVDTLNDLPEVADNEKSFEMVNLDKIRRDGGTQSRIELNEDWVDDLIEVLKREERFKDPVRVMYDGENYWLYDGFHRTRAAEKLRYKAIYAEVRQGTLRDAIWESLGANKENLAERRKRSDIRNAIRRALLDPEWSQMSSYAIAAHVGQTSEPTVRRMRKELAEEIRVRQEVAEANRIHLEEQAKVDRVDGELVTASVAQSESANNIIKLPTVDPNVRVGRDGRTINVTKMRAKAPVTIPGVETPVFKPEPPKIVQAEFVPTLGDRWTMGDHTVYCGLGSDKKFQEILPKYLDLTLIAIPRGCTEDWAHQWVEKRSNVIAVFCQDADYYFDVISSVRTTYQYAMFTRNHGVGGFLAFFAKELPRDEFDFSQDAECEYTKLIRAVMVNYTKPGANVCVVEGPSDPYWQPLLTVDECDRTLFYCHRNSTAIGREVQMYRLSQQR